MDALDSVTQNQLLRIVAELCRKIKDSQSAFEDEEHFVCRGEAGWKIQAHYVQRGAYRFFTYDPASRPGLPDAERFFVVGQFDYVEPGDSVTVVDDDLRRRAFRKRFKISTDFPYMIPVMSFIMTSFEAIMGIPVRHGNDDPLADIGYYPDDDYDDDDE